MSRIVEAGRRLDDGAPVPFRLCPACPVSRSRRWDDVSHDRKVRKMRIGAVPFPAFGALALLPAVTARADVTSCRDEARQMAQTYLLSVSPAAPSAAQSSASGSAEPPATTESRGMTAATDSLASSGGTLPSSTSSGASEPRGSASAVPQLGAADRAKVEGLLSDAQAGDALGKADQCRKIFQEALAVVKKARP